MSDAGPKEISKAELADELRALGVEPGGVLLVHTSFRAVRPVEGGPPGLIEALQNTIGPAGTLVMPSMADDDDAPFDPRASACAGLGVVAETFRQTPGVMRSDHPFAFAAAGPKAGDIVSGPLPLPPHGPASPAGRVHDLDGQVLLLGAGHDANTMLHLAEVLADVPYGMPKHCTVLRDGRAVRVDYDENDHCCMRFTFADEWLQERGLQHEGRVGHGQARLMRARDLIEVAVERLTRHPLVFLHPPGAGCAECDLARASVGS